MPKFEIKRYFSEDKQVWDKFVTNSRNGTFLFLRDYMDYHKDKFTDASYLVSRDGILIALIAGNVKDNIFISHGGLTFGGWLIQSDVKTNDIINAFSLLNAELDKIGVTKVIYKPIPSIYHLIPSEEDLYALFQFKAQLTERKISSSINQFHRVVFSHSRKDGIRKAKKNRLSVCRSTDIEQFWTILTDNLAEQYSVRPVHELAEIKRLAVLFPDNIVLFTVLNPTREMLAGALMYISRQVAHVQYISATPQGKTFGALDLLFEHLITLEYKDKPIFDFGHSCEKGGLILNNGLLFQKEGFGGRGICYDTYEYSLKVNNGVA